MSIIPSRGSRYEVRVDAERGSRPQGHSKERGYREIHEPKATFLPQTPSSYPIPYQYEDHVPDAMPIVTDNHEQHNLPQQALQHLTLEGETREGSWSQQDPSFIPARQSTQYLQP